jgi:hypothetical protein
MLVVLEEGGMISKARNGRNSKQSEIDEFNESEHQRARGGFSLVQSKKEEMFHKILFHTKKPFGACFIFCHCEGALRPRQSRAMQSGSRLLRCSHNDKMSLFSQSFDRRELRGFPGWIDPKNDADGGRKSDGNDDG